MSPPQKPGLLIPATASLFALIVLFHVASARAAKAAGWETVFESEDVLIKKLPARVE